MPTMSKSKNTTSKLEVDVFNNVKKRLTEKWNGESVSSFAEGNLSSIPEFVIDELSDEFVNNLGRRILAQINVQPLEPSTRRNMKAQLNDLLTTLKKDLKSATKGHLERFFQVY